MSLCPRVTTLLGAYYLRLSQPINMNKHVIYVIYKFNQLIIIVLFFFLLATDYFIL